MAVGFLHTRAIELTESLAVQEKRSLARICWKEGLARFCRLSIVSLRL
jgi:hypothetical protein